MKTLLLFILASFLIVGLTAVAKEKKASVKRFKGVEVTWLGHSAFLLKSPNGKIILIDPWLDNPKAPEMAKDIKKADIILLTHGHFDHIGSAPAIAKNSGSKVVSIFEISRYLARQGVPEEQLIGMNYSGTVEVDGIKITMVPAVHSSGISDGNNIIEGGNPAGFVVEFENGFKVYHTGDTGLFGDMALIRKLYAPDLMLVCIGGHFTMGPKEAAEAIKLVAPKYVIPMHYGTFPLLAGTPAELKKYLPAKFKNAVIELNPGEVAN
ncbi:MAG: metal-dependent hydrolase [Candidatus Kryptonium sp.]|nr:metal-dependent hydrolase [Candidatus Kryptonium sp.]MCX7761446.1 metal-dependent hydrolase [Candidatus Kryptonium sp.]MDW8109699.1 metal-dependent hydrolase [Candidatus Kryptonium sp.]